MEFGVLNVNNFARIKQLKIDLSKPILHQVKGINEDTGQSNETGKSTIYNALSWCLFGIYPSVNGKIGDGVINPLVGDNCLVEVPIIKTDRTHLVTRTRKHFVYNNQLLIGTSFNDGREDEQEVFDLGLKNIDASNKAIEKILGMDYQTFIRTNYFPQEGVLAFGSMTDADLKNFFLNKLLDLSWIKSAHEEAKDDLKELEKKLQTEEFSLISNKKKLEETLERIENYKEKSKEWNEQKITKLVVLSSEIKDLNDQKSLIITKQGEIKKKIKELQVAMSMLSDGMDWNAVISKIDQKRKPIVANIAQYKNTLSSFPTQKEMKARLNEIKSKIGEKCSECGSTITTDHLPHLKSFLLQELRKQNKKRRELKPLLISSENALKALDIEVEAINRKREKNAEKSGEFREMKAKLESLYDMTDTEKIDKDIDKNTLEYNKLKKEVSPFEEMMAKEEDNYKATNLEIEKNLITVDDTEKEIGNTNFWIKAFSSQGIQSFVLDGVTQIINRHIAGYMLPLSDGRISASFDTVNRLKSGEYREKFKLNINNLDGGDTYASLSGGAKKRVDIAVSLAISDFKRSMSGSELKFLVLDETNSGMDSFWTSRLIEMIVEKFRGYSVWFITHQEIEPYYFDEIVVVRKRGGFTELEE